MAPEDVKLKYPSPRKPNVIYTDPSTTINIAFNHTATQIAPEHLEAFKQTMMQIIRKMQSSVQFLDDGIKEINSQPVVFFEFVSPALDGDLYNFAGFTVLDRRALLINFNCFEADMAVWQPIIFGMLDSLRLKN
jgi:hypothetical protein